MPWICRTISRIFSNPSWACILWWDIIYYCIFWHCRIHNSRIITIYIPITSRESIIISPLVYISKRFKILTINIFIINPSSSHISIHHREFIRSSITIYNIYIQFPICKKIIPMCVKSHISYYNITCEIPFSTTYRSGIPTCKLISWQFWIISWICN